MQAATRFLTFISIAAITGCASPIAKDGAAADAAASPAAAAGIPDTDIYLARIAPFDTKPIISAFENATSRKGYDNQPSFLAGQAAFYYVAEGEGGKTDIRLFDIARRASQPVFASPDRSEYSPKETPGGALSYIQENIAGDVTEVHWRIPGRADDDGKPVIEFAPLGYYAWLDEGGALAVFYRSEPGSLYAVDVASGKTEMLDEKIGRGLEADRKGEHLWFVEMTGDEAAPSFRLMQYDRETQKVSALFELPGDTQDFAVTYDIGGLASGVLAANGAKILSRSLVDKKAKWEEVADLSGLGVVKATRIAVSDSQGWIAVVGETTN